MSNNLQMKLLCSQVYCSQLLNSCLAQSILSEFLVALTFHSFGSSSILWLQAHMSKSVILMESFTLIGKANSCSYSKSNYKISTFARDQSRNWTLIFSRRIITIFGYLISSKESGFSPKTQIIHWKNTNVEFLHRVNKN